MIRARQDLAQLAPVPELPARIDVRWACQDPLESGLPSTSDYAAISAFEGLVVPSLGHIGVLAFVFTHRGSVEYTFYCRDVESFIEHLNEALESEAAMPIEISGDDDPEWASYRALLNACGVESGAA
jgi:hypothetical protein